MNLTDPTPEQCPTIHPWGLRATAFSSVICEKPNSFHGCVWEIKMHIRQEAYIGGDRPPATRDSETLFLPGPTQEFPRDPRGVRGSGQKGRRSRRDKCASPPGLAP